MERATNPIIAEITEVRAEYTSARLIFANLRQRLHGGQRPDIPGYLPAEIDYRTVDGRKWTLRVRNHDVRSLDRVSDTRARQHLAWIHLARAGDEGARQALRRREQRLFPHLAARFMDSELVESEYVVPYTSAREHSREHISNKGAVLFDLSRRGFATSDFCVLTAETHRLPTPDAQHRAREAIHNLETLSGRRLGDPGNPLLIAMRSAMPIYIPGFMPTFLNVGYTPAVAEGLPRRYGQEAAARIRINNRKTLLEALDSSAYKGLEGELDPELSLQRNLELAAHMEALIARHDAALLDDPHHQVLFFLSRIYDYYDAHLDTLRGFMGGRQHYPAIIFQRMVCSVIDEHSYAGVLYSRNPRTGQGVRLQYARTVFGEDLMTGRMLPQEVDLARREDARERFPAVYHFWPRLAQLEALFRAPVMVEFTGVHGTFTILQVDPAELSGPGMLTAVMDLHRAGSISADRVRELVQPYHVRQIESDTLDARSIRQLQPFCTAFSILPRSAVSGRLVFSGERARRARKEWRGDKIILVKRRFHPTDAINMQAVDGICSLSPAAIHVVTTAQNLGIPALLNLEAAGVRLEGQQMINAEGTVLREGDPVTISSRRRTLYLGRAGYAPARLLRFMDGEPLSLWEEERARFQVLARDYNAYRKILENVEPSRFTSLKDLGHAIRYGKLRDDPHKEDFVNRCYDVNDATLAAALLDSSLGTHLVNLTAWRALTPSRQTGLLGSALGRCATEGLSGYRAGAFILGYLVNASSHATFWASFSSQEAAHLLDEWLLHQKYLAILTRVGERRVGRAQRQILSQGLGTVTIDEALVRPLLPLKLSGLDLRSLRDALPTGADPQTHQVLDLLGEPLTHFFDVATPWGLRGLQRLLEEQASHEEPDGG